MSELASRRFFLQACAALAVAGGARRTDAVSSVAPRGRRPVINITDLYHPHQGTLTGVIEVTSPEFLLRDPADRNARVAGWGRVLAAAARTGTIKQVHLLERSIPHDGASMT